LRLTAMTCFESLPPVLITGLPCSADISWLKKPRRSLEQTANDKQNPHAHNAREPQMQVSRLILVAASRSGSEIESPGQVLTCSIRPWSQHTWGTCRKQSNGKVRPAMR
jgi:hypothetical protein